MIEELIVNLINLPDTYIGEAPIGIDNCQWVKLGSGSTNVYFAKGNYDRPAYSIYVRNISNEEAATCIQDIFKRIRNFTDAKFALLATRMPAYVGKDDKHRSVYTCQFEIQTGSY